MAGSRQHFPSTGEIGMPACAGARALPRSKVCQGHTRDHSPTNCQCSGNRDTNKKARYRRSSRLSLSHTGILVGRGRLELPTNGLKSPKMLISWDLLGLSPREYAIDLISLVVPISPLAYNFISPKTVTRLSPADKRTDLTGILMRRFLEFSNEWKNGWSSNKRTAARSVCEANESHSVRVT